MASQAQKAKVQHAFKKALSSILEPLENQTKPSATKRADLVCLFLGACTDLPAVCVHWNTLVPCVYSRNGARQPW